MAHTLTLLSSANHKCLPLFYCVFPWSPADKLNIYSSPPYDISLCIITLDPWWRWLCKHIVICNSGCGSTTYLPSVVQSVRLKYWLLWNKQRKRLFHWEFTSYLAGEVHDRYKAWPWSFHLIRDMVAVYSISTPISSLSCSGTGSGYHSRSVSGGSGGIRERCRDAVLSSHTHIIKQLSDQWVKITYNEGVEWRVCHLMDLQGVL